MRAFLHQSLYRDQVGFSKRLGMCQCIRCLRMKAEHSVYFFLLSTSLFFFFQFRISELDRILLLQISFRSLHFWINIDKMNQSFILESHININCIIEDEKLQIHIVKKEKNWGVYAFVLFPAQAKRGRDRGKSFFFLIN